MPPKPPPGKKGADEIDMSDLASLPSLNFFTFTVLYNRFFSQHTREKLQKYVNDHLSQERVKVLTRDEIITYGKGKQYILEAGQASTLPQDDPRAKMSEADQLAKSAYERLFELQVIARRTKKERLQKLEDEAKIAQQQQPLQIDTDLLDIIFHIVDFPQTKEEAIAFAKLNTTLNLVFDVNQTLRRPGPEDDDETLEALQVQEQQIPHDQDGNDKSNEDRTKHRIEQLFAARAITKKTNVLRHLAHLKLDFINFPFLDFKLNEHGEEFEVKKEAEVAFSDDFNAKLEHYGALYIKYQRFREKVSLMPLAPDTQVLSTLMNLQGQSEDYKQWLSNVENLIASLDQHISSSDPGTSEHAVVQKKEAENERASKAADEEERRKFIHDCRDKLKESVDDKYYLPVYDLDPYKQSFLPHKEGQNSIGSIMSAMVSQIAAENSYSEVYDQQLQKIQQTQIESERSTNDDTIDDLFESFNASVNFDLQIWDRPSYRDDNDNTSPRDNVALGQSTKARKKGAQPYLVDQNENGDVIEYNNEMDSAKRTLQKLMRVTSVSDEAKAEDICARTKHVIDNLVLPGISQRHLMPPVPLKSLRLRDQDRPNVYPFATLPVDEVERGLVMKAFQELVRLNHIDEGAMSDKQRHAKYKVFERSYEDHMTPDILRQVLAEALIQEPDVATLYYPRDDSLLVALYNKVRSERTKHTVDGERQWRAAYRVMPDFENWIKYFSDDMVVEAQGFQKVEGHPVKYQLDDEMIPDSLIDIDDQNVSNIQETSQMFYPYDGSLIKVDACSVGGLEFKKSIVIKDNLTFGLRKATDRQYEGSNLNKVEEHHGLISYKKVGETDLWLRFENDTKVLIESVQKLRNPQKLIRIDPPKPTAEEIAAREEALKQAQAAAAKNKGKPGAPVQPVVEEYKEPEPTWEPEPFDFLDTLFNDDELEQTFNQVTTTLTNGLIVQHLSDGNIIQQTSDQLLLGTTDERDRLFLFASSGVVVRHLRNRDAEVLFPNGVRAHFTKHNMTWIVTNNKGLRRAKKAGVEWDLEPVPCAFETDAVTNARMMIRDDKVMTIEFADGSLFCQHADGTLMRTSNDGGEVRIEKEGYAPVLFKRGVEEDGVVFYPGRPELETSGGEQKKVTPEQRSLDRVIVETHLPDGTVVDTYLDQCLLGDNEIGIQHIFSRPDFSILAVNQLDKIKLISSNARSALNESKSKKVLGQDIDYLQAISGQFDPHDLSKGIYTGVISAQPRGTELYISDEQANVRLTLTADLRLVRVPIFGADDGDDMEGEIHFDVPHGGTTAAVSAGANDIFENINGSKNAFTKHFILPRLFVIKNDGSGYELLTKEQLDYYLRVHKHSRESLKQRKDVQIGSTQAKVHYFLTKVRTLAQRELDNTHLKSLEFPQNSVYALLHLKDEVLKSNKQQPSSPKRGGGEEEVLQTQPDQFVFRQLFEFQPFEYIKQVAFHEDLERYKKWKLSQVRYDTEFGLVHAPAKDGTLDVRKIEEDEQVARKIITRVLKERKNKKESFNAAGLQKEFLHSISENEQVSDYQRRLTSAGMQMMSEEGTVSPRGGINPNESLTNRTSKRINSDRQNNPNSENVRMLKKKQHEFIEHQLQDIRRMVNTPEFVTSYYHTKNGQSFAKANPPKAPSQEVMMRMSQRIDRSQHNNNGNQQSNGTNEKGGSYHGDGHSTRSHRDQHNSSPLGHTQPNEGGQMDQDDKESPIVALEPEEPGLKQGSAFLNGGQSKKVTRPDGSTVIEPVGVAPSLYLQEKVYLKQREQEGLLKAEEYHVIKTKEFNVVGRLRQDKPHIKVMQKSTAQSELNEKFITTECIADRRVKISSMAPRQYINAPSVEDVRKQGQHQMILSAINKKQTFAELINQANAMVTSVLHDPLKRSFNVMPSSLKYGILKLGQTYELLVTLKNEDSVALRMNLKPLSDPRCTAQQVEMGLVAPGMIRKVAVTIHAREEGVIKDMLQIVTKSDVFKIPIEANILNSEEYEREMQEQRALNSSKGMTNSRVREKLNQSIQKARQSAVVDKKQSQQKSSIERRPLGEGAEDDYNADFPDGDGSPGDMDDDQIVQQQQQWVDTTNSESKLPVLPQADKRPFEVDPKKNLKDVLKK